MISNYRRGLMQAIDFGCLLAALLVCELTTLSPELNVFKDYTGINVRKEPLDCPGNTVLAAQVFVAEEGVDLAGPVYMGKHVVTDGGTGGSLPFPSGPRSVSSQIQLCRLPGSYAGKTAGDGLEAVEYDVEDRCFERL